MGVDNVPILARRLWKSRSLQIPENPQKLRLIHVGDSVQWENNEDTKYAVFQNPLVDIHRHELNWKIKLIHVGGSQQGDFNKLCSLC